jgi:hypothetical protein
MAGEFQSADPRSHSAVGLPPFIDPDYEDGAIVDFSHKHVVSFHPMGQEIGA